MYRIEKSSARVKTMKDVVIVANGDFLVKEIITEAIANKLIVALDGAAKKLHLLGITPNVILGDFDSLDAEEAKTWGILHTFAKLSEDAKPYRNKQNILIVPAKNQNETDLVKAIRYCDSENATSITIICASGGCLDHHEINLRALRTEYKKDRLILLHTFQQTVRYAKNETVEITGLPGDRCGVLAFPQGSFSSTGLQYDVQEMPLEFGFSESASNTLKDTHATVIIAGEALLIMPPLLAAQRDFESKTEVEQLEIKLRDGRL